MVPMERLDDEILPKKICCPEEQMLDAVKNDFDYQIRERGKKYYTSGNVIKVIKTGNRYRSKVMGSKAYNVIVKNTPEEGIEYECNCMYEYPCKHIYATIMTISNKEYIEMELKPEIEESSETMKTIIEKIPAKEIKEYLLTKEGILLLRDNDEFFNDYFRKYLPKQEYDYYYNHLYNELIIDPNSNTTTRNYLRIIKQYIDCNEFEEGYKIIKSIIEAYHDSKILNNSEYVVEYLPQIGMYLRISYRKGKDQTKQNIIKYIYQLKNKGYYNNYYLEDIIFSLEKEL